MREELNFPAIQKPTDFPGSFPSKVGRVRRCQWPHCPCNNIGYTNIERNSEKDDLVSLTCTTLQLQTLRQKIICEIPQNQTQSQRPTLSTTATPLPTPSQTRITKKTSQNRPGMQRIEEPLRSPPSIARRAASSSPFSPLRLLHGQSSRLARTRRGAKPPTAVTGFPTLPRRGSPRRGRRTPRPRGHGPCRRAPRL